MVGQGQLLPTQNKLSGHCRVTCYSTEEAHSAACRDCDLACDMYIFIHRIPYACAETSLASSS